MDCSAEREPASIWRCECGGLLDVVTTGVEITRAELDRRARSRKKPYNSGVWLYKELVHPLVRDDLIVTRPEGNTNIYTHAMVSEFAGIAKLSMKHEGENPTGSFKDRGMTVGISEARRLGHKAVGCASTGNTSASLASYAALCGMRSVVFIPSGEIAYGKLAQAMAFGARVLQIRGNFDDAMRIVQEACGRLGLYLLNSINPWRIEGQKSIAFELIQQLRWKPPDWVIVPAGNLGNTSAIGKALVELRDLALIERLPRLAAVQAEGANPFYSMWKEGLERPPPLAKPETLASAIRIGNPVSWKRAMRAIKATNGVVEQVSDQEIMDAKAVIDSSGIGCEPASAASLAGAKRLRERGIISSDDSVVCILTGNILKDPGATVDYHTGKINGIEPRYKNSPVEVPPDIESVMKALR